MADLPSYENSVFINCPFDEQYSDLFRAMIFCISVLGFLPRCSLEISDGGVRLLKIVKIIGECKYGLHDLSRTELDAGTNLPRFNMPLELGIDTGCRYLGNKKYDSKCQLILDKEKYRYQAFISDIAGLDIEAHGNDTDELVGIVRNWLRTSSKRDDLPGGSFIQQEYDLFIKDLPDISADRRLDHKNLTYTDLIYLIHHWIGNVKSSLC